MKFLVAKNDDKTCLHCKSKILYGEHYFLKFSYKAVRSFAFHIECYRLWVDKTFVKAYLTWKESLTPPKRRGRPRKYPTKVHSREVNRLKALQRYHREAGNEARVQELQIRIEELDRKP